MDDVQKHSNTNYKYCLLPASPISHNSEIFYHIFTELSVLSVLFLVIDDLQFSLV
jgi:hypothetical protein